MARRRMIEVSIAYDKAFNSLSDFAQLVYLKTLPHTDDFGRFDGDPATLKARIDPLSKKPISKYDDAIKEVASTNLWFCYNTGKQLVIQYRTQTFERINAFLIKQRGNPEYPPYKDSYKIICGDMLAYPIESNKYKVKSIKQEEGRFPIFWDLYPKRNGKKLGKAETEKVFLKFSDDEQTEIMKALSNYRKSKVVADGFPKDPIRFLRKDFWKDWLDDGGTNGQERNKYEQELDRYLGAV